MQFFAHAIAICYVNTSKLQIPLECNYSLYTNTFFLYGSIQLWNGWHISHRCPYKYKFCTLFLHMQWYSSRC